MATGDQNVTCTRLCGRKGQGGSSVTYAQVDGSCGPAADDCDKTATNLKLVCTIVLYVRVSPTNAKLYMVVTGSRYCNQK